MLLYYALGQRAVRETRALAHSAMPGAPVVPDPPARESFRVRAAASLHRLADRVSPIESRAGCAPLRRA